VGFHFFRSRKDNLIEKNQDNYSEEIKQLFLRHSNSRSRYEIAGGLIDFYDIENEKANAMAEEIYDIVLKIYEIN